MAAPALRVFLVDDHEMVLHGLVAMLSRFPEQVAVVGTASDPADALTAVADLDPDVVLCDVRLRGSSGLDLCASLLRVGCLIYSLRMLWRLTVLPTLWRIPSCWRARK